MSEASNKKRYLRPTVTTEKVFEQAALGCVVRDLNNANSNTLKLGGTGGSQGGGGCGFTSS